MRKGWLFLFFLCILGSCDYFNSKEAQTQKLVNDELVNIDWNEVDQYPLFESCDETASKEIQLQCFQQAMLSHMTDTLKGLKYEVSQELNDTVNVDVLIDEHGFMTVLDVHHNADTQRLLPELNEELTSRLNDLTTVAPALKRGIPVGIKFRLPIVLNTTD